MPNAGLLPAAALAQRVDLAGLVDQRVRLAAERANGGAKAMTVIGSILAGGDSIDDTDLLRAGGNQAVVRPDPSPLDDWELAAGVRGGGAERPGGTVRGHGPATAAAV
jgi:hypothetical protein